jgi:hypothetical protein
VTIFGATWDELTLADVESFLADADDEPLLWEAKGTKLDANEVRLQVCGFANSHEGGYLILGARKVAAEPSDTAEPPKQTWTLDGVGFPDEPRTWVSNVVGDLERGVRPMPDFDVAAWTAPAGHVAVVSVTPTSTPPCIANGTVYERIPGKTQTVRDPQRLANLFARGDEARRGAQARADRSARLMLDAWDRTSAADDRPNSDSDGSGGSQEETRPGTDPSEFVRFAVGVAATGNAPNIAGRLFQIKVVEEVWLTLRHSPSIVPEEFRRPHPVAWSQEALLWRQEELGPIQSEKLVRASWDGAVAAGERIATASADPETLVEDRVQAAWQLADDLVTRLGGFGDTYLCVLVAGGPFAREDDAQTGKEVVMRRGPLLSGVDGAQAASLGRELSRALGYLAPEPANPDAGSSEAQAPDS